MVSKQTKLIEDLFGKWEEYFEMAGDNTPYLMMYILATEVLLEREQNEYLRKRLENGTENKSFRQ